MENHNNQYYSPENTHILIQLVITLVIVFIISCSSVFSQTGWFSQPLPVTGQVNDLKFLDANTGLIAMWQTTALLRTTNGGYNWNIVLSNQGVGEFEIIDSNTIYALGETHSAYGMLLHSYNRGLTWDSLPIANSWTVNGISFVNKDTGWVGGTSGGLPYLWRTTNAGVTWTVQSSATGQGKVFFLKNKVNGEYIGWSQEEDVNTYKTTNSGFNWFQIQNIGAVTQLQFKDQNTGYAAYFNCLKITTNGGLNWTANYMPSDNGIIFNQINLFKFVTKDTVYGDYGTRYFGNNRFRGIIWVSTNGGLTWGFQQPDTSINRSLYSGVDFINSQTGWTSNLHTTNGGGPVIYPTYIDSNSTIIPRDYILKQNYPNPFNPSTTIEFSLPKESYVKLKILDLSGRTVFWVAYDMLLYSGLHKFKIVDFEKLKLSSGVYFYQMEARDINNQQLNFFQTRKMILLK